MPQLTWPTKNIQPVLPADLKTTATIFPGGHGYPNSQPESHLFLGDNEPVMTALLPDYEGRLGLIYADPPFLTNKKYPVRIGRGEDSRNPQDWQLTDGYTDHWPGIEAYLDFLYPRLVLMYRLLAPNGTLYLHLDWHADAYARILLDELFGRDRLLNELVWVYHGPSPIRRAFNRKHDTILVYTKGDNFTFNTDAVREPYNPNTVKTFAASPKAGFGKVPDLKRGKVPEDWWYFPVVARLHKERTGYPTQKPEGLIKRILLASSNPNDIVADFFCGSGTFPAMAANLGRKFLASDVTWRAVHTTRTRLIEEKSPFAMVHDAVISNEMDSIPLKVDISGRSVTIETTVDLDYWEIDPDYDGDIFQSAAQARRPNRSAHIPLTLTLNDFPKRAHIRGVTVTGKPIEWKK